MQTKVTKAATVYTCDACGKELSKEEIENLGTTLTIYDTKDVIYESGLNCSGAPDLCHGCQDLLAHAISACLYKHFPGLERYETNTESRMKLVEVVRGLRK